ncbi:hypothetical protein ACU5EH_20870 [Aliivibrio salmonicida]|uniref:hypothetical protein n=1 Tax=Aliivibrio salmonicida TaxID=40269 RepID=UPI00406C77D5
MEQIVLDELKRKADIFSKELDVDKYISEGVISRYKNTKTQFIINCSPDKLPEEIGIRANKAKSIPNKDGLNTLVFTLNIKVRK